MMKAGTNVTRCPLATTQAVTRTQQVSVCRSPTVMFILQWLMNHLTEDVGCFKCSKISESVGL